jgi:uncharacterized protein
MKRYLYPVIRENLGKKIILLSGPRQVGKTTLSKHLVENYSYYNYDIKKDQTVFSKQEWDRSTDLVIFDELHKMKKWKLWLKGVHDEGLKQKILVTGSARMEIAKKMGDSLAGRFFSFRLYPLDLKELKGHGSIEENYKKLITSGGFPEPFLDGTERFYRLWQKSHQDVILRQDLLYLENIRDIDGLELLVELLAERVGSTISVNSLAEDLSRDDKTITRWLRVLENMYLIFKVGPYSRNIARGIKKSSKYFFYDIGRVNGDEAAKLENLVALSLKKELEFQEDSSGLVGQLHFAQTREKHEMDFVVLQHKRPAILIEVKLSDDLPSKNFYRFQKFFPNSKMIQLVRNLGRRFETKDGIQVECALPFLADLDFS